MYNAIHTISVEHFYSVVIKLCFIPVETELDKFI